MALRTLKEIIREKPGPSAYAAMQEKIRAYPDRAAAIMLSTFVEDKLEILVFAVMNMKMNRTDRNTIFEGEGFLSRFSSKILLASALNLIGPETRRDLIRLKDIRNAFAHARTDISFDTPEVAARCDLLELPGRPRFRAISEADIEEQPFMKHMKEWHESYKPSVVPRERFVFTVSFMESRLWHATIHTLNSRIAHLAIPSAHVP